MAYWLGEMNIQEKDLSNFIKNRKNLLNFYEENMKFRIMVCLDQKEYEEYRKAVKKKYGSFSALNSRRAALDALRMWIKKDL